MMPDILVGAIAILIMSIALYICISAFLLNYIAETDRIWKEQIEDDDDEDK